MGNLFPWQSSISRWEMNQMKMHSKLTSLTDNAIPLHFQGVENAFLLSNQILNGYRMEKPKNAPNFIGETMTKCWQKDPKERPTFSQLADVIEKQIESVVGFDYLNLCGSDNENGLIREIFDPTPTNRLEIVKFLNETKQSQPTEGIENLSFFSESEVK
jgi:hypothetical protein